MKMHKVLHLQTHLPSSGNAAFRLHEAFLQSGIDSSMLSLSCEKETNKQISSLGEKAKIVSIINDRLQAYITGKTVKEFGAFSFPVLGTDISHKEQLENADIIYIHWAIGGFLSLKNIEQLIRLDKPVIFFMHDMWTFTGGCHYSFSCEKYKQGCGNCQLFPHTTGKDLSARQFNKKAKLYSRYKNLYFVSPSKWLYTCARQSALVKNKPVFHIPNVIDKMLFRPFDKKAARQILNIDTSSTVICFGAISVNSVYKGWEYLRKALELLDRSKSVGKITALIFGSAYDKQLADSIPFPAKFMGRLKDDYSTALVYNAADVFLAPSLADNLPTTVMESLCCGTPVVGFDIGGIPDMVIHKQNGYLSKYKDAEDLAGGIKYCIENGIKGYLPPDFDTSAIIDKHLELYEYIKRN